MAVMLTVYDELVEYLARRASPQEVLAFEISDAAKRRAETLLERNSAGMLTPAEVVELEQMSHFDGLVSVLKAQAQARLNKGA